MCEFISWYEVEGNQGNIRVVFLTDDLVPEALKLGIDFADLPGHEAIKRVMGWEDRLPPGTTAKECNKFDSPDNFPAQIVEAIKAGRMTYDLVPPMLLRRDLRERYQADLKPLDDQHWADRKLLNDRYWSDRNRLATDLNILNDQAARNLLNDRYWFDLKLLNDRYCSDVKLLKNRYWSNVKLLGDQYWGLFAEPANRAEVWR